MYDLIYIYQSAWKNHDLTKNACSKIKYMFQRVMYVSRNKQQLNFESQFFGNAFQIPDNDPYLMIERMIDWDELLYNLRSFYHVTGRSSIPVKNLVLLLLFKHYDNCSDVELVEKLAGSLPMQKALNITFMEAQIKSRKEIFSKRHKKKDIKILGYINPSTLSKFRKRLGAEGIEKITAQCNRNVKKEQKSKTAVVDTSVCQADIAYPTDIGLLEKARQITLRHLKDISKSIGIEYRTYSQVARKTYLNYIKLGKKKKNESKKVQGKLIRFLERNLRQVKEAYQLLANKNNAEMLISNSEPVAYPKEIQVIEKLLEQQKELRKLTPRNGSKQGIHIKDRIVSIFKPHIRPISRGKIPNPTEFGAKILLEMRDGFITLLKVSFDNVADCKMIEPFFELWRGMILGGDRGMHSKENTELAAKHGIRKYYVEKKGKKSLEKTNGVKRIRKIRPAIEAKIGLLKRKFGLNRNRYKRGEEGEAQWIQMAVNALNLRLIIRKKQLG